MKRLRVPHWHWHYPAFLVTGWRWWLSEIRGTLPFGDLVLSYLSPARRVIVITPTALSGSLLSLGEEERFSLRIPESMVLRRRLTLPQAPMVTLRQIVAHEIERLSPLRPQTIYYDLRIEERDQTRHKVTLEIRMTHREPLDQALIWCRQHGLHPDRLELEDSRFLPTTANLPRQKLIRLDVLLTVSTILLAIGVVLGAPWREQRELDALSAQMTELRIEAHRIDQLRDELKRRQDMAVFLPKRRSEPLSSTVLAEVARVLPDHTWLFQMELNGNNVRLRGYSASASSLIALFEASPLLSNAQFRAPLTPGLQPGQERFDISVEVREAAP